MAELIAGVELGVVAVIALTAYLLGCRIGKKRAKPRIIVAAKRVDNRLMPNYTRAQRRAHKRSRRG